MRDPEVLGSTKCRNAALFAVYYSEEHTPSNEFLEHRPPAGAGAETEFLNELMQEAARFSSFKAERIETNPPRAAPEVPLAGLIRPPGCKLGHGKQKQFKQYIFEANFRGTIQWEITRTM